MFGIGHMPELVIILVVAALIFGPGKLPSVGTALGKGLRDFKREVHEVTDVVDERPWLDEERGRRV